MMMIVKNDDKKKAPKKNTLAFNNAFFLSGFVHFRFSITFHLVLPPRQFNSLYVRLGNHEHEFVQRNTHNTHILKPIGRTSSTDTHSGNITSILTQYLGIALHDEIHIFFPTIIFRFGC